MFITSGFVELNDINNVDTFAGRLLDMGIEVTDIKDDRIVFLIERKSTAEIRKEVNHLKSLEDVKNVSIAYYSTEGATEGGDFDIQDSDTH